MRFGLGALCIAGLTLGSGCDPYGKSCADLDGDGFFSQCKQYDDTFPGPDCDDTADSAFAVANWESCDTCVDADGDGVALGCDQFNEAFPGPDCDDTADSIFAVANWESCDTCVDADGDGAYAGCDQYVEGEEGLIEDNHDGAFDIVILLEGRRADALAPSLVTYRRDLRAQGLNSVVKTWDSGSAFELRDALEEAHETYGIQGAFLVGDLPAAWYEQEAHGRFEQFPTDIFLQEFDTDWSDRNGNGVLDGHTNVNAAGYRMEIYVSRLTGTDHQIQSYFEKLHRYKTEGPLVDPSMFIFIDDDWQGYGFLNQKWGLDHVYDSYSRMESPSTTRRNNYVQQMTQGSAEYVYQWVHSSPTTLYFDGYDQYQTLDVHEITDMGVTGSFFNLFDCSASRFTEENLAEMYLHQTYGLATIGSTKAGGIYSPWVFHDVLASGGTWGEGYIRWYEAEGRRDDSWFLGIVVMGDPTLTLSNDTRRAMGTATRPAAALTAEQMQELSDTMVRFQQDEGSFTTYREAFPQYH